MSEENTTGEVLDESGEDIGEDTQEVEGAGQASNPTDEIIDKIARKYKVKLDGEEIEVDEDELIRGYQLRKVSDQRLQEGVKARKQASALLQMLKTDPRKVLTDPRIGIDVKKMAEDIIYEGLQEEMMSPEQRELAQYKKKVHAYEAQQQKIQQEQALKEEQMLVSQKREAYVQDISDALENSGLPRNDYTVGRVVHEMTKAIKAGFGNVKAHDVIDLVYTNYIKELKTVSGNSSEETLLKLLGDEVTDKIRKYDVNKYHEKNSIPRSSNVKGKKGAPRSRKQEKVLTPSQLRAKIEAEYGIDK